MLLFAAPASAAPTCENRAGDAVHCDAAGALPLGARAAQADRHFDPTDWNAVKQALVMVMLLLALIALLPNFDGARWDRQESDED